MDTARPVLDQIQVLLARYGYDERATFVANVSDLARPEEFWRQVAGLEFWGGSGAVWEVEPFHLSHPEASGAVADYRQFQALMVELAGQLESKGLSDLAARTADLFRRDLGMT